MQSSFEVKVKMMKTCGAASAKDSENSTAQALDGSEGAEAEQHQAIIKISKRIGKPVRKYVRKEQPTCSLLSPTIDLEDPVAGASFLAHVNGLISDMAAAALHGPVLTPATSMAAATSNGGHAVRSVPFPTSLTSKGKRKCALKAKVALRSPSLSGLMEGESSSPGSAPLVTGPLKPVRKPRATASRAIRHVGIDVVGLLVPDEPSTLLGMAPDEGRHGSLGNPRGRVPRRMKATSISPDEGVSLLEVLRDSRTFTPPQLRSSNVNVPAPDEHHRRCLFAMLDRSNSRSSISYLQLQTVKDCSIFHMRSFFHLNLRSSSWVLWSRQR